MPDGDLAKHFRNGFFRLFLGQQEMVLCADFRNGQIQMKMPNVVCAFQQSTISGIKAPDEPASVHKATETVRDGPHLEKLICRTLITGEAS